LIRVELIYGHRSFLGNFFAGLSALWLSAGLGIAAALVALYFIPFADLWANMESVGLPLDEGVPTQEKEIGISAAEVEPARQPAAVAEESVLLPPVVSSAVQESEHSEIKRNEPMLVLPPIGGGDGAVAAEMPKESTAGDGARLRYTTACQTAVEIKDLIPSNIELGLLSCNKVGQYELSGIAANGVALRQLERALQARLADVSSASWSDAGGGLYFELSGRLADTRGGELATLSSEQARRLFGKVEHWADQCGIDAIDFSDPTSTPLIREQVRLRRKLVGTGSYMQIGVFLGKLRASEETAALGELILNPVQTDGHSSVEARLSAAIDVVVGAQ